jgi:hypothetical protein
MSLQRIFGSSPLFSFLILCTVGSLDWESVRCSYTQDFTNTEWIHTDIHAYSGIRNHDPSVSEANTVHASDRAALQSAKVVLLYKNNPYSRRRGLGAEIMPNEY